LELTRLEMSSLEMTVWNGLSRPPYFTAWHNIALVKCSVSVFLCCMVCIIPKYWWELNLVVGPKIAITRRLIYRCWIKFGSSAWHHHTHYFGSLPNHHINSPPNFHSYYNILYRN
jgi:hypothetical protein